MKAIDRYRFGVVMESAFFRMMAIGVNRTKRELFFHFPTGSNYRCEAVFGGALTADERLPDHISIHTDGTTHYKSRNGSGKVYRDRKRLINHPFNLPRGGWMPLFCRSYFVDGRVGDHDLVQVDEPETLSFAFPRVDKFSFIILAKANNIHPADLMRTPHLSRLSLLDSPLLIPEACHHINQDAHWISGKENGTDLVSLVCRETLIRPPTVSCPINGVGKATSMTMSVPLPEQLEELML